MPSQQIIGMQLEDATRILCDLELNWRITNIDDVGMIITTDVKMSRLNLIVKDGIVTEVTRG